MKIAFAGSFAAQMAEPVQALLSFPSETVIDEEVDIIARLSDVDVLVGMGFSDAMADAAPKLKLVQVAGAGLDRIDRGALRPGTYLANVYGHEAGIAEYVIAMMLDLTKSYGRLDAALREGRWESQWAIGTPMAPLMPELAGKTLGILGFGHIGQAVARRAAAFDMRVVAIRSQPQAETPEGVAFIGGPERLDEVLAEADYLVVTLALNNETRDLLDARRLALLKPSAYVVNVARGEIINEAALYEALAGKSIAGAALDVWYRYPTTPEPTLPSTMPFHEFDNVIMTPHVSGWTEGMLDGRVKLIAENIERIARGEPPLNLIES